jgi:hypothetical protein
MRAGGGFRRRARVSEWEELALGVLVAAWLWRLERGMAS